MRKVKVEIEMDMPFHAMDICNDNLSKLRRKHVVEQGCHVEILFLCDKDQLLSASEFLRCYIPRAEWDECSKRRWPNDVGACETFRFRPHSL